VVNVLLFDSPIGTDDVPKIMRSFITIGYKYPFATSSLAQVALNGAPSMTGSSENVNTGFGGATSKNKQHKLKTLLQINL